MLHYYTSTQIGGQIWHVRIYQMFHESEQLSMGYAATGHMSTHWQLLQQWAPKPTVFDPRCIEKDGIGERTVAVDGEMLQGTPEFSNLQIKFTPDRILAPLVDALRDTSKDLWVEIVVEQAVQDLPAVPAGEFFWPRKKRLWYWGKALRKEGNGDVVLQERTINGSQIFRDTYRHTGSFSLTFVHWLKTRGLTPARTILSKFMADRNTNFSQRVSWLLYAVVEAISPCSLFAIADYRTKHFDGFGDTDQSVAMGNILLSRLTVDHVDQLANIWIPYKYAVPPASVFYTPYWDADTAPGPMSLFQLKDASELIVRLTEEFDLKFQVELPTLQEAATTAFLKNTGDNRKAHWTAAARWLFLCADLPCRRIEPRPQSSTIHYTPSATWLNEVKATMPTPNDLGPDSGGVKFGYADEEAESIEIKTLFRLPCWHLDAVTHAVVYDYSHVELQVGKVAGALTIASAAQINTETGTFNIPNWGTAHAWLQMLRWGQTRATVEFDSRDITIEPYGASAPTAPSIRRTFGTADVGEFGLLRAFDMNPGLLYAEHSAGTFSVFEITQQPGKDLKLKAIEISNGITYNSAYNQEPPAIVGDPLAPPVDNNPTINPISPGTGATVSGTTLVKFSATDDTGVATVKFYVNGALYDFTTTPSTGTTYSFSWNTTTTANGTATLKGVVIDIAGHTASVQFPVTVSN